MGKPMRINLSSTNHKKVMQICSSLDLKPATTVKILFAQSLNNVQVGSELAIPIRNSDFLDKDAPCVYLQIDSAMDEKLTQICRSTPLSKKKMAEYLLDIRLKQIDPAKLILQSKSMEEDILPY